MSGRAAQVDQIAAMTRVIEVTPHAVALRAHLRSIVESPAFKGSRRSQEFLQFVVEHALNRHFDELKERTLGVELFGRSPSYDTGDDAIVRVTACDVRKRLSQYYAESNGPLDFRVELSPGSYIPEFRSTAPTRPAGSAPASEPAPAAIAVTTVAVPPSDPPALAVETPVAAPAAEKSERHPIHAKRLLWVAAAVLTVASLVAAALWLWNQRRVLDAAVSPGRLLPWSALIQPNHPVHVIFCDPEIVTVQRLLNYSVTLSDYANQHYWPAEMKPEVRHVFQSVAFRGATVAAVDAGLALRIGELIVPTTRRAMEMHTARNLRLGDFKTDDSFVLFGSPRSNPWVELFQDQLDFVFEFDSVRKAEFVRNKRPRTGETPVYIATAEGWGTGHAYAIVALAANPDQKGRVLLLAGSNAEATQAAGHLATDLEALARILKSHGIDPNGPTREFEILLRVSTMAGSPNTIDVVAIHLLNARPSQS